MQVNGGLLVKQDTTGVGVVSLTSGSTLVNGLNTQFLTTFKSGDTINISGVGTYTVTSITGDTGLFVNTPYSGNGINGVVITGCTATSGSTTVIVNVYPSYYLGIGDQILISGTTFSQTYTVTSASYNSITINTGFTGSTGTYNVINYGNKYRLPYTLTANSSIFKVNGNGNVGIGTSSPQYPLHVSGNTFISGSLTGSTIIKSGGTSSEYLMADGSTSKRYKYRWAGTTGNTGTVATINMMTITIPPNTLSDYLNIESIIFEKLGSAGGCQFKVWTNTTNNFATATQLANYAIAGTTNQFAHMSRFFHLYSGLLIGFPATPGNTTGTGASNTAIMSIPFNTAVTNYLFISTQLDFSTDTINLRGVSITE
jgi:hypothetical protein